MTLNPSTCIIDNTNKQARKTLKRKEVSIWKTNIRNILRPMQKLRTGIGTIVQTKKKKTKYNAHKILLHTN